MFACWHSHLYRWRPTIRMNEAWRIKWGILVSDKILIFSLFVGCFYRKGPALSSLLMYCIIAACFEDAHALPVNSLYWKSLKQVKTASMAKRFRWPARNQRVAGWIPRGDMYFHFEFFACFPFLQVGGAFANEIKHDHSPVVIVVLDSRHD